MSSPAGPGRALGGAAGVDGRTSGRAPAASGPDPWQRWSLAIALSFMVFLVFPAMAAFRAPVGWEAQGLTLAAVLAFAVVYLVGYSEWRPWLVLGALLALTAATVPVLGPGALGLVPYVGVHCALELPRPAHLPVALGAAAIPLPMLLTPWPDAAWFALLTLPVTSGMLAVRQMIHRGTELQEVETAWAVSAERERVARDVHDVLGHSLTAIVLKADLAERLIGRDEERARAEVAEVAALARTALGEARSTVVGLRSPQVEAELDRAADLARSAGAVLAVEGSATAVPPRFRPVTAWVLREAVTNVARHAGAAHVTVRLAADRVEVQDDGRGLPEGAQTAEGSGMRGIRERVTSLGGTVTWSDAAPGTRLVLTFPTGASPTGAAPAGGATTTPTPQEAPR